MTTLQFTITIARELGLFALLIAATYTDIAYGRICNWLVYPAIAAGLVLAVLGQAAGAGGPDIVSSMAGLAMGAGIFGFFFLKGAMGAADVKLAAAIGALKGWEFFAWALVYITLAGCILAVAVVIWRGRFLESMKNSALFMIRPGRLRAKMEAAGQKPVLIPYGVAMAVGTMFAWFC